ncbi:MAG: hypothetical protein IJ937_09445 [Treponema sp.]|nr:hypothetical protein [Treponema sp.]
MKKFKSFFYVMIFGFCCFAKMFSLSVIPPEIISDDTILRYKLSYYGFEYELFEYDENGNLIYYEESGDKFEISEYDENGLLISRTSKIGFSMYPMRDDFYYEYNSEGKLSCVKGVRTFSNREVESVFYTYYDLNGYEIFTIKPNGEIEFKHFDDNGNLIKDEEGTIYKYNEKNQMIYSCTNYGREIIFSYDENGNLIEERYNPNNPRNEFVITYEYNEFGQKIYENQYTYEAWYTYNSKGLLEKCTVNKFDSSEDDGDEIYEYDENGNLIHFKNWDVNLKFEYEFFPNGNIKRKITRKVE